MFVPLQSMYVGKIFKSRTQILVDRIASLLHLLGYDLSNATAPRTLECQMEENSVNRPVNM